MINFLRCQVTFLTNFCYSWLFEQIFAQKHFSDNRLLKIYKTAHYPKRFTILFNQAKCPLFAQDYSCLLYADANYDVILGDITCFH